MNMTLVLAGIILWFGISSAYFLCNMGKKNMKEPWYIWIFLPPVIISLLIFLVLPFSFGYFLEWVFESRLRSHTSVVKGVIGNIRDFMQGFLK
jgi:hypothetical protein